VGYVGPTTEICGNGLDENCNGVSDDPAVCAVSPACTPGTSCATGLCGICATGTCNAAGDACIAPSPGNEAAACGDNLDNDCDCLVDAADPDCGGSGGGNVTTVYTGVAYEQLVLPDASTNTPLPGSTGDGTCEAVSTSFTAASGNCLIVWVNDGANTLDLLASSAPVTVEADCSITLACPTNTELWQENVNFSATYTVSTVSSGNQFEFTHTGPCGRHLWRLCW